jgi:hypothetical protein
MLSMSMINKDTMNCAMAGKTCSFFVAGRALSLIVFAITFPVPPQS